jgi:hypothetical protein
VGIRLNTKTKLILLVFVLGAGAMGLSFNWFKGRFFQNYSLEQLWAAKSVTPEEFTQLYASLLKKMVPDHQVVIIAPLELQVIIPGHNYHFKTVLENVYKDSQMYPTDRKEICINFINSFISMLAINIDDQNIDPNKIIPIIKDRRYIDNLQLDVNSEKPLVFEKLAGDIYIIYAIEEKHSFHFLLPSEMRDLNLSFEQLQKLAVDNLTKARPEIGVATYEKCSVIETSYPNKASLLLYDKMWEQIEKKNGGQIVAAVPGNDMLIFTTTETTGGIAKLKEVAHKAEEIESYLISQTLLIRQNGKWEVFQ